LNTSRAYSVCKRAVDIAGSIVLLVSLLPVLVVCAIAIKFDSPGPVLYRGSRVGRNRRVFTAYKFRSMRADADNTAHLEYLRHSLGSNVEPNGDLYKLVDDDRVTRVGRVLRRWSLDEVPQLLNVLRGQMSLVGPRPEVPYVLDVYEPWQFKRFDVLPGLTGLWQVSGRARLSPRDMLELDCRYAERRSLLLDTEILVRTIPAVVGRIGSA
jgi:lipopolysaccharide/colanic/teichoic acid biosynthesis glycosyltransferase